MGYLYNEVFEQCNLTAMLAGIQDDGIMSGLDVGESSPAAMSVRIAPGSCSISGTVYSPVSYQNVVVTAADATNPRKDIVTYRATGPVVIALMQTLRMAGCPPT